jgi:hydrophobe/amphiphile efflux-3 (HAE3) family protein
LAVVLIALVLGLGGAALALRLHPSAAADTFVGRSSSTYRATQRFYGAFGEEPVDVMVQGSLQQLLLSSDIDRLVGLEGCLSGNVPPAGLAEEGGSNGPCGQLGRLHTVKVVIGPGTFIQEAAEQIDQQLSREGNLAETGAKQAKAAITRAALSEGRSAAEAHKLGAEASKITLERYAQEVELVGAEYGLSTPPTLEDPSFVSRVVFDNTAKLPGTPKQRFAYLFPGREAALISVRMKPSLSEAQRADTIAAIRRALAMPQWRLQHGERYLLTGEPVIVAELSSSITHSIELLLLAVLLAMALALTLVFRGRPRLLPLAIAMLALALTFGALALIGAPLTVAQVAVLPVLVGLAVDYAIQFQSRVQEARAEGAVEIRDAIQHAAAVGGPTIAAAAAAGGGALLVLTLSPVPTVRGFGLLLVVGIALAFLCALTVGSAALVLTGGADVAGRGSGAAGFWRSSPGGYGSASSEGDSPARTPSARVGGVLAHVRAAVAGVGARLAPSWRGAQELLRENALTRFISRAALVHAVRHPGRVIGVGLVLAALGWGLDTQTHVETNLEKLVPQSLASLRNLDALERASGVGGEIDLMVSAKNLATPAVVEWMSSYQNTLLKRFGYTSTRGCGVAKLCPAFSLPSLFKAEAGIKSPSTGSKSSKLTRAEVSGLLGAIPPYFSQNVITPNRRVATLAFGIRLMPLAEQQRVIEAMRAGLHPPAGVSAQLVGLPVLAAQSGAQVASPWRRVLTLLAGLAAAALILLAAFRGDRRRALTPLLPVLLATGWSALVVFVIRVPLNPMSVTLSALVIAVSTEFSVLLSERHRQERIAGYSPLEALHRTYSRTGAAVAASGVTAIVGFGVLVLSDIAMLRDFGVVTLVDLTVSLIGVLVSLPAALLLAGAPEGGSAPELTGPRTGIGTALATLRARLRPHHEPV